jgi:Tol biopolymer transport system component
MKGGTLTLMEVLDIAFQVASALAAAHKAGIVHRDIKPENIMIRPDGYVKVLDFGLAKLIEQYEPAPHALVADRVDISSGLVLGTLKYMSPEQARGLEVDPRSDIFSFGVVLYEMITGHAPFEGDARELIASILPEGMQQLISKALCKKKEERYQTIQELLVDLKSVKEETAVSRSLGQLASPTDNLSVVSTSGVPAVSPTSTVEYIVSGIKRHKTNTAFILAGFAVIGVSLTVGLNRFSNKLHAPTSGITITRIADTDKAVAAAISPVGDYVVYAEKSSPNKPGGEQSLWVLQVATNNRRQIVRPADIDYRSLTYSPDGGDIFYVSQDVLFRVSTAGGGATKVLSDVQGPISFAPDGTQFTFVRVLNSGEALLIANLDGGGERVLATRKRPEFLMGPAWSPDGLLIACGSGVIAKNGQTSVIGFEVTTGQGRKISDQRWDVVDRVVWLPDGSGLIASEAQGAGRQIWEIPYPPGEAHKVTGEPNSYSHLGLTADGKNLVALESAWQSRLWLIPNGDSSAAMPITSGEHRAAKDVSWTPDGKILYASYVGSYCDIWIMNGDGTNQVQLTTNAGMNRQPQASSDGRFIVFSSNRAGERASNVWRMDIDGKNPVQLTKGSGEWQPVCSPDGRWVFYLQAMQDRKPGQATLWKVPIAGGEPVQLSNKPTSGAAISPDGRVIACWYPPDRASPSRLALIPIEGGPPIKILDGTSPSINLFRWSPDGQAISYIKTRDLVSNIWSQPVSGGPAQQLTQFTTDMIQDFSWSRAGQLLCSRSHSAQSVVLISNFR